MLCPGRLLRDGGGSADEDEAFTLVEAAIQDLPAALREIARLRAALDAAAATPAALATPAPEPADAAPAADAPAPADDAAPAPEPMEAEPTAPAPEPAAEPAPEPAEEPAAPAADDAHEAEDAPLAVDAVAALAGAADLEAASLTHTDDGSRFLLRWRGGGASCVRVEDGAWRVVDVAGAATAEARVGRALALAAALAAAVDVPRSGVDGAMAAFLGGAAPAAPSDAVEDAGDDDDSAGDFEAEAAAGTAMLVEGDLASDGEASSSYDGGSDDDDEGGDDSGTGSDHSDVDSDDEINDYDVAELNERHDELGEVRYALGRVAGRLNQRLHETRGLVSLNSNFRAALQKTVKMHHQRHKQYVNVIDRLVEYRSHVDRRRRDLGYESPHHDG